MASILILAAAVLAQSAPLTMTVEGASTRDRIDVAYEELSQGRNEQGIARIKANRSIDADEPAALINLGTAHARMGQTARAEAYFRAAIISRLPCDLQLADGQWMDSRRAARMATTLLRRGETIALR